MSPRAIRILRDVSLIACEDTRVSAKLCDRFDILTPKQSCHNFNEESTLASFLGILESGEDVALISDAGTPTVSDPGARLVAASHDRGLRVIPIPGACAVSTAISASGFEADHFTFLGFLPRKGRERKEALKILATSTQTVVFYESPKRLNSTLGELAGQLEADRKLMIGREISKLHEECEVKSVAAWAVKPPTERGEVAIVVEGTGEKAKQQRIIERYEFFKSFELKEATILAILGAEFEVNSKRIKYLLEELQKES